MRSYRFFLEDMKESLSRMLEITENKEYKEFSDSWVMMSAVRDQIMVLGEAAKQIPPDICEEYPEVPWNNLAKTRDKLIHGYFRTDPHLLYMMASVRAKNLLPIITSPFAHIKITFKLIFCT